jgi:hypothetical protein
MGAPASPSRESMKTVGTLACLSSAMQRNVAFSAKRNQVLLRIIAGLAAKFFVMNLEIGHRAARLASPSVATQHLIT